MKNRFFTGMAATVAAIPLLAHAQPAEPAYHSAFADYRPYQEPEPGAWRALNDAVGAAALEQPEPAQAVHGAPAAPSTPHAPPSAAAAPAGQAHHHHHPGMQHAPAHGGQR